MAALTADRTIRSRASAGTRSLTAYAASGVIIYLGALVAVNAAGYAVPASDTAAIKVIGVCDQHCDNSAGGNGALEVLYRTGVEVEFNNDTTHPVVQASLGRRVMVVDDNTVGASSTNSIVAGEAMTIEPNGAITVYVDVSLT